MCPDRECGYRRSVKQTTNARCPNCHKRMEQRALVVCLTLRR